MLEIIREIKMSTEKPSIPFPDEVRKMEAFYKENIQVYVDIPLNTIGLMINVFNIFVFMKKNVISLFVNLLPKKEQQGHATASSNFQKILDTLKIITHTDPTVLVILIVIVVYLSIEIIQGIFSFIVVIRCSDKLSSQFTGGLEEILDTLSSINTSVTFMIYYAVNRNFKILLKSLYKNKKALLEKLHIQIPDVFSLGNLRKRDTDSESDHCDQV